MDTVLFLYFIQHGYCGFYFVFQTLCFNNINIWGKKKKLGEKNVEIS